MGENYFTAGEVAARLGIKRYRLEYLLTNDILPDTARVGNRRLWTESQAADLEARFRRYEEERSHAGKSCADNKGDCLEHK